MKDSDVVDSVEREEKKITRQEVYLLLVVCIIPFHIWAIINILRFVPSWILSMSVWEMISVISYALMYTLAESLVIFLGLVLLFLIVPRRYLGGSVVALGMVIVCLLTIWLIILFKNSRWLTLGNLDKVAVWFISFMVISAVSYFLIRSNERIQNLLTAIASRLSILAIIYVIMDILALLIVAYNNLVGVPWPT